MSGLVNGWTIDHIAVVVADLEATIALYTQTLGFEQAYREIVADQGVEAVGIRTGDSVIELLRPLDENSPIAKFRGDAPTKMHHIAYRLELSRDTPSKYHKIAQNPGAVESRTKSSRACKPKVSA